MRTQKVALDLATVLDQDLKSASIQLGKALNDPVANLSALSRSGIQFSTSQKEVIKSLAETGRLAEAQGVILEELERQYGGQAEAAAKVGTGLLEQLNNVVGDVQELLGERLFNSIKPAVQFLKDFLSIDSNQIAVVNAITAVGTALSAIAIPAGLTLLGGVLSALLSPLAAVAAGIAALVYFKDDIAEWAFGVADAGAVIQASLEVLGPIFGQLGGMIADVARGSLANMKAFADSITDIVNGIRERVGNFVPPEALDSIKNFARAVIDVFVDLAKTISELLVDALLFPVRAIQKLYESIGNIDLLPDNLQAQFQLAAQQYEDFANRIDENAGKETVEAIGKSAKAVIDGVKGVAAGTVEVYEDIKVRAAEIVELRGEAAEVEKTVRKEVEKTAALNQQQIKDAKALKKLHDDIAAQQEIVNAARLGEHQERVAREILNIRRQIADISIDEARALAEQNVFLDEQLEIVREQRRIIEEPFDNLASNLEEAIINGGRAGVGGLKGIFKAFIQDLKSSFLLSLFQPLLSQIRNLTSGIAVPLFGAAGSLGGVASSTLLSTNAAQAAAGGVAAPGPAGATGGGAGGFLGGFGNVGFLGSLLGFGASAATGSYAPLAFSALGAIGGASLVSRLGKIGVFGDTFGSVDKYIANQFANAGSFANVGGGIAGSIGSSLLFGNGTGTQVGSAIGGIAGNLIPVPFLGPLIGSLLGGAIGSLFGNKTSFASVNLGAGEIVAQQNASKDSRNQARDAALETSISAIEQIAQVLGAEFVDGVTVGISQNGDRIRAFIADPTGRNVSSAGPDRTPGDSAAAARDAVKLALEHALSGISDADLDLANALIDSGLGLEQVAGSLAKITQFTRAAEKPLSQYAQAMKDINAAFDEAIAAAAGVASAEQALTAAREAAIQTLRNEFADTVLEAEIARTDSLLSAFRDVVKANADFLSDDIALNDSGDLTASLRAGNYEDFFTQAFQAGESVSALAGRMAELEQVVLDLGGEIGALETGFAAATSAAKDFFDDQVQADIGQFLDGAPEQLEALLNAQAERLEKANDLGADLFEVERLTALELRQFFKGLTDQGLQEVSSFLGLFEEATNSVVRNLDLSRQDLQGQADAFRGFAQQFAQISIDNAERFLAASPRESIDILRGRAGSLLEQLGEGNQSAAQALPQVLSQLLENARQSSGNTKEFTDVFNFVQDTLSQAEEASLQVVSDVERQIAALDESNVLLSDIRDILASSQAASAFFSSYSSGGIASADELLAVIQNGAGLTAAANDNATSLSIVGLIGQSIAPIVIPLADSIDTFTQRLADMPSLQRIQIEATENVSAAVLDVGQRLEESLDRLETLSKKTLQEMEEAA